MNKPSVARWLLFAPLFTSPFVVLAQNADAEREEHGRIVSERAAAEERYLADERACRQRFVVISCLDDAKRLRRATLVPLRERQIALDTVRRERSAAERKESISKKASEEAERAALSASSPASRHPTSMRSPPGAASASLPDIAVDAPIAPTRTTKPPAPFKPAVPQPLEARIGDEAGNRAAFVARGLEAEQHRRDVAARNAERDRKRSPAKVLPEMRPASGAVQLQVPATPASSAR